ncbi:DNA-directed RNA polymerase core subunit rpc40 [Massospora cicadina]|nr:DNA-directed RNA polymerase core subunit rpc40 [Massospora cicadina]
MDLSRTHVILAEDHVAHVSSTDFPHQYPGEDLSFDLSAFKKFDLIGVDASFANAFRRILIAEVPTMAIENVYIMNNTSIIQDEVLAHRLGLIPIVADPNQFDFKRGKGRVLKFAHDSLVGDSPTDLNTIIMKLNTTIETDDDLINGKSEFTSYYLFNNIVLSGHIEFDPKGDQVERFKDEPIKAVYDDILIAKLRPGQAIEAELHLCKGIGRDHAKWSPVATASYRLLPEIIIKEDITGPLADKFVSCFPAGVAEVRVVDGVRKAVIVNPRKCTMSREVLRYPELAEKVILARKRDHFIFNIESTGIISPQDLFLQAILIMIDKCKVAKLALAQL